MELNDKIIIRNYTNLSDLTVMECVLLVIRNGKISETKEGKQYCFHTTFKDTLEVSCSRKGNTYTFYVYKEKRLKNEQ